MGKTSVRATTRKDGTVVRAHERRVDPGLAHAAAFADQSTAAAAAASAEAEAARWSTPQRSETTLARGREHDRARSALSRLEDGWVPDVERAEGAGRHRLRDSSEFAAWEASAQEHALPGVTISIDAEKGDGTATVYAESWLGAECHGHRMTDEGDDFCDACGQEMVRTVLASHEVKITSEGGAVLPDPHAVADQSTAACDLHLEMLAAETRSGIALDMDRVRAYLAGDTDSVDNLAAHKGRIGFAEPPEGPLDAWNHALVVNTGWPEDWEDPGFGIDTAARPIKAGDRVTISAVSRVVEQDYDAPGGFLHVSENDEYVIETTWSDKLDSLCSSDG